MPTTDELATQVAALTTQLQTLTAVVRKMQRPDVTPAWVRRACQVCGIPAQVIDISDDTLDTIRNGEGYCLPHATAAGVLNGAHLTKP